MVLLRRDREELRYIYLENVLQDVNREFIALNEDEKKRNNVILNEVLKQITEEMKRQSQLFKTMYRKEFYGGSYFDNLKVGEPNEYDLDLLLDLPKCARAILESSDKPGYVHIRLENMTGFLKQLYSNEFPDLAKRLLDENDYLSTSKALSWIQSILTNAVDQFPSLSPRYPYVKQIDTLHGVFYFVVRTQGPAFTLKLYGKVNHKKVKIDIDLVPCFVFTEEKWPNYPYRQNPIPDMPKFFVVPKQPTMLGNRSLSSYWRLSFQEQEGVLIKDLQNLKPALRLLKKLRDACDYPYIASYYLKTIFLWEVERNRGIWNKPLSYVFMMMLKEYQACIAMGTIPYFWNEENNLIARVNQFTLFNGANRLQKIIKEIERYPNEPERIIPHLTRVIPASVGYDFWSNIEDLPENKPQDSWCTLM